MNARNGLAISVVPASLFSREQIVASVGYKYCSCVVEYKVDLLTRVGLSGFACAFWSPDAKFGLSKEHVQSVAPIGVNGANLSIDVKIDAEMRMEVSSGLGLVYVHCPCVVRGEVEVAGDNVAVSVSGCVKNLVFFGEIPGVNSTMNAGELLVSSVRLDRLTRGVPTIGDPICYRDGSITKLLCEEKTSVQKK